MLTNTDYWVDVQANRLADVRDSTLEHPDHVADLDRVVTRLYCRTVSMTDAADAVEELREDISGKADARLRDIARSMRFHADSGANPGHHPRDFY